MSQSNDTVLNKSLNYFINVVARQYFDCQKKYDIFSWHHSVAVTSLGA
jgi:hypothetical protein